MMLFGNRRWASRKVRFCVSRGAPQPSVRDPTERPPEPVCHRLLQRLRPASDIGDIRRFAGPAKLVAYVGLKPGQRESGRCKHVKLGVGHRGRCDLSHLLVQGAHAVMRSGRSTSLGILGCQIFARKGQRNMAVVAVARNLLAQVRSDQSLASKLAMLARTLGSELRVRLALPGRVAACVLHFQE